MADEGYDDTECTPDEMAQYDEAMKLNAKLKEMMAAGEIPAEMMAQMQMPGAGYEEENEENYGQQDYDSAPRMRAKGRGRARISKAPGGAGGMSRRQDAPAGSHLKNRRKNNHTFTDDHLREMGVENKILYSKLNDIARKPTSAIVQRQGMKKKSSNAINRRKQQNATAVANQKMLGRLQSTKSSYSNSKLKKDYSKQKQIANRIRTVQPKRRVRREEWQD